MRSGDEADFETFVRGYRNALVRVATTMAGGDRYLAEDVVQGALVKVYLRWPPRGDNPYGYVRRAVVNGLIDHQRRPFVRRERATQEVPDGPAAERSDGVDVRLLTALAMLPLRMRAAVVLRHVEGLSVEETALALDCSTGNVKSQTSRGLDRLRELLAEQPAQPEQPGQHHDEPTKGDRRCLT